MIQGELPDISSTALFIETHSMFGVIVLAGGLNIGFIRQDFNDKHFISCACKKTEVKIPLGFESIFIF